MLGVKAGNRFPYPQHVDSSSDGLLDCQCFFDVKAQVVGTPLENLELNVWGFLRMFLTVVLTESRVRRMLPRRIHVLSGPNVETACRHTDIRIMAKLARCLVHQRRLLADVGAGHVFLLGHSVLIFCDRGPAASCCSVKPRRFTKRAEMLREGVA